MFKLLKLKLVDHHFFGDIDFTFVNEGEENEGPYITMIIGPNGVGKSQLLRIVLDIFNGLASAQETGKLNYKFPYLFSIIYLLNDKEVKINFGILESNGQYYIPDSPFFYFLMNGETTIYQNIPLPSKYIASANSISDKYPFFSKYSKYSNKRYEYLGLRSASNNAYIKSNIKNVINNLLQFISVEKDFSKFNKFFLQLKLDNIIRIKYKQSINYQFIHIIINSKNFEEIQYKLINEAENLRRSNSNRFKSNNYERIFSDEESLKILINFVEKYKQELFSKSNLTINIKFNTNEVIIFNSKHIAQYDITALKLLYDLDVLVPDSLVLNKETSTNNIFSLEESSSGEYHLITTFINIISVIENNSIVLIDEPEISLHPNWQMQYVSFFNNIFSSYSSCHFIICSHSHLIVSDLVAQKSAILSVYRQNTDATIKCELFDYDTKGWSPENILYRIFGVSTVRNFYFENDIRAILSMISHQSDNIDEMKEILNRLKRFDLTQDDPLKVVINRTEEYINNYVN